MSGTTTQRAEHHAALSAAAKALYASARSFCVAFEANANDADDDGSIDAAAMLIRQDAQAYQDAVLVSAGL